METKENYNFIVKWNVLLLSVFGCWPDKENLLKSRILFHVTVFMLIYFGCGSQMIELFLICRDLDSIVENLSNSNIGISNAVLKIITFWRCKKELKKLVVYMKEDWDSMKNNVQFIEMRTVGRISRSITIGLIIMTQGMVTSCLILQLFCNLAGVYPTKRLYFRTYYLYNPMITPIYEITWFLQYVAGVLASLAYVGVDSFIGLAILHVCGQMTILCNELKNLSSPVKNGEDDAIIKIRNTLQFITRRHNHLISMAEQIEDHFNAMFLIQTISLSVQICFQGCQCISILETGGNAAILQLTFMALFLASVIILFYIYCYVGEQIHLKTMELRSAAYECDWYDLPQSEVRSLAFIILRTQNPPTLTAGKFCTFNMITFSELIKRSVGYLSVLLTIR